MEPSNFNHAMIYQPRQVQVVNEMLVFNISRIPGGFASDADANGIGNVANDRAADANGIHSLVMRSSISKASANGETSL